MKHPYLRRRPDPGARPRPFAPAALLACAAVLLSACTFEPPGDQPSGTAPSDGPPLAVKIDNVAPARPHTGLDEADIVHVEQVESGLSRILALYVTGDLPPAVGPVRSARETDLELLRQYDRPVFAYSGSQSKLQPAIDAARLHPRPPGKAAPEAYYRSAERAAPHNLYLRPDRLDPRPTSGDLDTYGVRFGPRPEGGDATDSRTVRYPSASFTFTWSAKDGSWQVAMDGARTPQDPATVVIQYTEIRDSRFHDRSGNITPFTETVGKGRAQVLRDGRTYEATWQRPDADDGTEYTGEDGERIPFAEGQVWVVYVQE